jgi:hypothetical protein
MFARAVVNVLLLEAMFLWGLVAEDIASWACVAPPLHVD